MGWAVSAMIMVSFSERVESGCFHHTVVGLLAHHNFKTMSGHIEFCDITIILLVNFSRNIDKGSPVHPDHGLDNGNLFLTDYAHFLDACIHTQTMGSFLAWRIEE